MLRRMLLSILLVTLLTACGVAATTEGERQTPGPASPAQAAQVAAPTDMPTAAATAAAIETAPLLPVDAPMMGCTVQSIWPTPGATQASLFPPVDEREWRRGAQTAFVTIIEYSDFQ